MARRKSAKNEIQDPSLPLKKRARWRLIGACVLAMGAMIILPFALESEPRRELGEVAVRMPPRTEIGKMDRVLPGTPRTGETAAAGGPGAGAGAAIGATAAAAGVAVRDSASARGAQPSPVPTKADSPAESGIRTTLPNGLAGAQPVRIGADGRPVNGQPIVARSGNVALPPVKPAVAAAPAGQKSSAGKTAAPADRRQPASKPSDPVKPASKAPARPAERPKTQPKPVAKAKAPDKKAPPMPKRRTDPNSLKAASPSGYVVQIGAFSSSRGARAQVARGAKLGFKPYTEKVKTSRGDRIRVRVGPYLTKKQANEARARLRAAGIDTALIAP